VAAGVALTSMVVGNDVALDVGTAVTRLAVPDRGIVFAEPTIVAINTRTGAVVDVGFGAQRAVVESPEHAVAFRPLAKGATVDFDVAARLIRAIFERAGFARFGRLRVVMSVPALATPIERRALRQATLQAGAGEVSLIETPVAAAIGNGMPIHEPQASAVVTLGAGSSEVAIISLGGIVTSRSLRLGGADLDAAIATMLRQRYGVVVSLDVAASVKESMGSALALTNGQHVVVPARTVGQGRPVTVEVLASELNAALHDVMVATVRIVQECLGDAPPDLAQDVLLHGLTLSGGHAKLADFPALLARETGVAARVAPAADSVVVKGLERCLEDMSSLHALFRNAER